MSKNFISRLFNREKKDTLREAAESVIKRDKYKIIDVAENEHGIRGIMAISGLDVPLVLGGVNVDYKSLVCIDE